MNHNDNFESNDSSSFYKNKLHRNILEYFNYDPNVPRPFEMDESTVQNFFDLYMNDSHWKLTKINPNVISFFTIRIEFLNELIAKHLNAKYVKLSIVQVPGGCNTSNNELLRHHNNLYFFFSLSNGSNQRNLTEYFDLNSFNYRMLEIPAEIADKCFAEFHALDKTSSLRKAMLEVVENNTEHIYMEMNSLVNDFLKRMKKNQAEHVALVFCQIDSRDKMACSNHRIKSIIEPNNNHFAVLLVGVDDELNIIKDAPVYDFNELCPNMCPKA